MTPELYFLCTVVGPVEADPEYQLIVDSNNMAVEIDNEISESLNLYTQSIFACLLKFVS